MISIWTDDEIKKYNEYLKIMEQPVMPSQLPKCKIDMKGLLAYAREKGVEPAYLSEEEKERFIVRK